MTWRPNQNHSDGVPVASHTDFLSHLIGSDSRKEKPGLSMEAADSVCLTMKTEDMEGKGGSFSLTHTHKRTHTHTHAHTHTHTHTVLASYCGISFSYQASSMIYTVLQHPLL